MESREFKGFENEPIVGVDRMESQDQREFNDLFQGAEVVGVSPQEEFKPTFSKDDKIRKWILGIGGEGKEGGVVKKGLAAYLEQNLLFSLDKPSVYALFETATDFSPIRHVKYWRPEERDKLVKASLEDPSLGTNILLTDLLWTELDLFFFSKGGQYAVDKTLTTLGKAGKTLFVKPTAKVGEKIFGKKLPLKPVEDTLEWAEINHNYDKAVDHLLKRKSPIPEDKNLRLFPHEIEPIKAASSGDVSGLKEIMLDERIPSDAFKAMIDTEIRPRPSGGALIEYKLTSQAMDYLNPATVRRNFLIDQFSTKLESPSVLNMKLSKLTDEHIEVGLRSVLKKFDSEDLRGIRDMKLEDMSVKLLDNALEFVDKDHRAKELIWRHLNPGAISSMRPVRVVFEKLDPMYQTMNRIHRPITEGTKQYARVQSAKLQDFWSMLTQKGLAKVKKINKDGIPTFERTKLFTPKIEARAVEVLTKAKKLIEDAGNIGTKEARAEAENMIKQMKSEGLTAGEQKVLDGVLKVTYKMHDKLYGEMSAWKVPQLIEELDGVVTRTGIRELNKIMYEGQNIIGEALRTSNEFTFLEKHYKIREGLGHIKKRILEGFDDEVVPWIVPNEGRTVKELQNFLDKGLTMGKHPTNFKPYMELDFPGPHQVDDFTKKLYRKISPVTKQHFDEMATRPTMERRPSGLDEMIAAKVRHHARQMTLHDTIKKVIKDTSHYPDPVKEYVGHYISRVLGIPSKWDGYLARFLQQSYGRIERLPFIGREGVWDANRAMELSRNINDYTYMGFLGLKPFSAMRNLFQPLLMVPADLGGATAIPHLLQGYAKFIGTKGARAKALREMGILSDYGPEIYTSSKFLNIGKKNIGKLKLPFELPTRSDVRQFTMWLFRWSDEANRYVTGSAAWEHFDWALKKFPTVKELRKNPIPDKMYNEFFRKLGTSKRRDSVRDSIESFVRKGNISEARATYIRDVVADTQYLYGGTESPLASHIYGAPGRTAMVFQSWWINYGESIAKWLTHGERPADKVVSMANFMFSSAMVYTGARAMWGGDSAGRMVGFGPFPKPSAGVPMPPAMQPFSELLGVILEAAAAEPNRAMALLKGSINTGFNFLPGGLQISQSMRAVKKAPRPDKVKALFQSLGKFKGWEG